MAEFNKNHRELYELTKNRILLIGGNGFIGAGILSWINKIKCSDYFVIDKNNIDLNEKSSVTKLDDIFNQFKPNIVIVLAAIKRQYGDSKKLKNLNNQITDNIVESLKKFNIYTIYISSCAVYGEKNNQKFFSETSPLLPTSEYGIHKLYSEKIYETFLDKDNLLIIRPPLIYSTFDKEGYQPGRFINDALDLGKIELWGEGLELREFLNIIDASYLIYLLSIKRIKGVINLVSGKSFSYSSIVREIQKNQKCKIIFKKRDSEIVNHSYAPHKIRNIINEYEFLSPIQAVRLFFGKCRI